jgi:biopolymer transport protein ExbB
MGYEILKTALYNTMLLLQIEIIKAFTVPKVTDTASTTLWALLLKGGWVMLPILLLSILMVYAIIERLIVLQGAAKIPQRWIEAVNATTLQGDTEGVKMLCEKKRYAIARIIKAGIENSYQSIKSIERVVESTGQTEIYKLEKNLSLLGTIAGVAPMLGFLGTVTGMIQAFMAMAQETNQISPQLLSGGIYEAMITTAAGLVVGIAANLSYNYFLMYIQKATQRIENTVNQFLDIMRKHEKVA